MPEAESKMLNVNFHFKNKSERIVNCKTYSFKKVSLT